MEKRKGHYLGTEIEEKWWKRYRKKPFLGRGWGEYWQDEEGFHFLRYLAKAPISIAYRQVVGVKTGKWHSGRWAGGKIVLKIIWEEQGQRLSSGFVIASGQEEVWRLQAELKKLAAARKERREAL